MQQRVEPLSGDVAEDIAAKRCWVLGHYEPGTECDYQSIEGKLLLLETILNNKWIEPTETVKLQCLGVTFGDLLVQAAGLKWVIVEDEYGRDAALHLEGTSIKSFPLTSISKRVEVGERVDVRALFQSACENIVRIRQQAT